MTPAHFRDIAQGLLGSLMALHKAFEELHRAVEELDAGQVWQGRGRRYLWEDAMKAALTEAARVKLIIDNLGWEQDKRVYTQKRKTKCQKRM